MTTTQMQMQMLERVNVHVYVLFLGRSQIIRYLEPMVCGGSLRQQQEVLGTAESDGKKPLHVRLTV